MAKRVTVLWAMGGPLGLHHTLLWMLTLGGFGVGVDQRVLPYPCIHGRSQPGDRRRDNRQEKTPMTRSLPVNVARFAGQISIGIYFGMVALIGLATFSFFYLIVLPLGVGAWVHLVSSVGEQTTDRHKTLIACPLSTSYLSDCVAALLDMFWFFPWLRSVVEYFLLLPYRILGAFTGWGPSEESWRKVLEILLTENIPERHCK
ncbi:unnamed protein product [Coregonus sp. 'balchen']|nr:unnamed protein product [Coregonus sp. 'balchen']